MYNSIKQAIKDKGITWGVLARKTGLSMKFLQQALDNEETFNNTSLNEVFAIVKAIVSTEETEKTLLVTLNEERANLLTKKAILNNKIFRISMEIGKYSEDSYYEKLTQANYELLEIEDALHKNAGRKLRVLNKQ